jgi:hypothetical protein
MRTKEQTHQYNQKYYEQNKEKIKQDALTYYKENKEKVLTGVREYREENRELILKNGKDYYRRNLKKRLVNAARARSKKSGLEFNLTANDFEIPETCPLLGITLFVAEGRKTVKFNSASLDRIDSSKGYTKDNVWIISFKANTMKSNSTLDEFTLMASNWNTLNKKGTYENL